MYRNADGSLMDTARIAMKNAGVDHIPAPAYRALLKYEAPRTPLYDGLRDRLVDRADAEGLATRLAANGRIADFVREHGIVDRDDAEGLAGRIPAVWVKDCGRVYLYASGDLICMMGWRRDDHWCPSIIIKGVHHGLTGDGDREPPLPIYIGQMIERMKNAPHAHL